MSKKELHKRVKKLRSQIDDLRYKYHVLNDPEVTDQMYERLVDELAKIEQEHPSLKSPDSPTQRIASKAAAKFEKVPHQVPQWSFHDAFTKEDLGAWETRIHRFLEKKNGEPPKDLSYSCELKIDGLHIVLTYKKGALVTAATRGDGKIGEDVTQNIKTIHSVPLSLSKPLDLVVEGEVWLSAKELSKINAARDKAGVPLYANPRNVAAGTIRQLDPRVVAKRKLSFTAYDITAGNIPLTQGKELQLLKKLGFHTGTEWRICKTLKEVRQFWTSWEKKRESKPFWVDGVVVKVNQKKYQDDLGYTGKAPRWAIALKFAAQQGTTTIEEVYVQVGRTGALTPVARMAPVQLAGTTVTHATLHNFDEIKRLDVRVGDTVVVEKAGDIIPKVVRALTKMRTGKEKKVRQPKKCPICASPIQKQEIGSKGELGAAMYCTNKQCYSQELRRIQHFVSKKAFNIDGMGKKIVEQLLSEGLIKNVADIFTLTKGDIQPLERFAERSADNLIEAIERSKKISLARFIFSLGIPLVGEETAYRIATNFKTLRSFMRSTTSELAQVEDVGPKVAESIDSFFSRKENRVVVDALETYGVTISSTRVTKKQSSLSGKSVVVTGTLSTLSRDEARDVIRRHGGDPVSSVSPKTDLVVVGANPGSKHVQAQKLGIRIVSEKQFLAMIN
jgi:DNA ligase (NAD+)